ncbi:aspartate aminotransferase family protein [Klebsiella sp. BIGb0407]|uniref:class-III pyridoxal-phosphate-dependent aminotransferase n=1 Tax=Klebsiella sp. BIGb0407 TaxID=2940603 RepID=UPI0021691991|nr:aspartate aminotransferase family protein [Klebsiella sp. BIGb0407]MCS3430741.1 acetylornithine/succinyldiaminopimelate/putrescine aminotransferase [Klebsiella sp. BIGb0407]
MSNGLIKKRRYSDYINPYWVETLSIMELPGTWSKAENEYLYDSNNVCWLDCVAGFGTIPFGHNNPHFIKILKNHLSKNIPSTFPFGANYPSAILAEKIINSFPQRDSKAHFSSSGSEAVETALKMAMSYTRRSKFISVERGYHGLTLQSMLLNGSDIWAQTLPERESHVSLVSPGDIESISLLLQTGEYAALVLEISQGVGGGYTWDSEDLKQLHHLCHQHGTLLIVDEVQTGWGRSGHISTYSHLAFGLYPDLIIFSKGMTNGLLPLAVTISTTAVHASLFGHKGCAKIHGSTYSGYSAGIALGIASFDYLADHNICQQVVITSQLLRKGFQTCATKYNIPLSIEGIGLLITLTFSHNIPDLAGYCWECYCKNNILVNYSAHRENTLVLTPPLIISEESSYFILDVFNSALLNYSATYSRLL